MDCHCELKIPPKAGESIGTMKQSFENATLLFRQRRIPLCGTVARNNNVKFFSAFALVRKR